MTTLLFCFAWWATGVVGWVFWWVKEFDLEIPDAFMAGLAGAVGPFAWALGAALYLSGRPQSYKPPRILIRRRGR